MTKQTFLNKLATKPQGVTTFNLDYLFETYQLLQITGIDFETFSELISYAENWKIKSKPTFNLRELKKLRTELDTTVDTLTSFKRKYIAIQNRESFESVIETVNRPLMILNDISIIVNTRGPKDVLFKKIALEKYYNTLSNFKFNSIRLKAPFENAFNDDTLRKDSKGNLARVIVCLLFALGYKVTEREIHRLKNLSTKKLAAKCNLDLEQVLNFWLMPNMTLRSLMSLATFHIGD